MNIHPEKKNGVKLELPRVLRDWLQEQALMDRVSLEEYVRRILVSRLTAK